MAEQEKIPDFFAAAESKRNYEALEKAYFKAFDEAMLNGIPPGYHAARMKDVLRSTNDDDEEERRMDAQIDYMLKRWQMIRGYL